MKIVFTILTLTIFLHASSQNDCTEASVISVSNSNFKPLPFDPTAFYLNAKTGVPYGCGAVVCGEFCELILTKAIYDSERCEMLIEGYFVFGSSPRKWQPFDFDIFLAVPIKTEKGPVLTNVRKLATIESKQYDNGDPISYHDGFFKVRFSFFASDRLYFDAGQHIYLTEYSVGCLLQRNEYRQALNVK